MTESEARERLRVAFARDLDAALASDPGLDVKAFAGRWEAERRQRWAAELQAIQDLVDAQRRLRGTIDELLVSLAGTDGVVH